MVKEQEHIGWVDILRILACFLVVLAHCCDPFVGRSDANPAEFLSGAYWGSFVRCSVPLFVMISGVVLLPVKIDMGSFYSRRMKRILIPLVVWSLVTPFLFWAYLAVAPATPSPNIDMAQHTFSMAFRNALSFVFNFNYATTPLWYLYMLVGVYLFIPIIGAWLKTAQQKDIRMFLWIWGVSMCLPYLQMLAPALGYTGNFGNMGLLGICDWNPYGSLYYFSGFLGYIVLAHYLVRFPLNWSWGLTLLVAIPLFIVGYAITSLGFVLTQKYFPGNYAKLEIVWYFSGINVFMMTFAIFILIQKIRVASSPLISKIASLTFGIYLCHFLLVQAGYDFVYNLIPLPPYFQIPVIAVLAFSASLLVVWLLSKNRWTRKIIM